VVDDSIVVIENIKRHLGLGEAKQQAITTAVREVAGAVTASTVTTVAVFLPLALVGDITGELFRPFALTVTIALAASLFVALTIVPVLAYWFLPTKERVKGARRHVEGAPALDPAQVSTAVAVRTAKPQGVATTAVDELDTPTRLQRSYLPVIRWSLKRPIVTLLGAVVVLLGSVALIPQMETNFIGDSGQNTLTVTQSLPLGASLEAQDAAASQVETTSTASRRCSCPSVPVAARSPPRSAAVGTSRSP
jgi:HAE1 family hydrophobic/amphiphilic exporter-1